MRLVIHSDSYIRSVGSCRAFAPVILRKEIAYPKQFAEASRGRGSAPLPRRGTTNHSADESAVPSGTDDTATDWRPDTIHDVDYDDGHDDEDDDEDYDEEDDDDDDEDDDDDND
ncbi:hypothetical protein LSAT2_006250, partial [Lamellibrachia satsuma]